MPFRLEIIPEWQAATAISLLLTDFLLFSDLQCYRHYAVFHMSFNVFKLADLKSLQVN